MHVTGDGAGEVAGRRDANGTVPDPAEFSVQVTAQVAALADGLPAALRAPVRALAARPAKGLRPMLLAACAGFGRPAPARLVRLGALVELLHLASLLHDDMIDRAATRRGGPAAHTVVGHQLATLAGVACFALAGGEAASLGGEVARVVSHTAAGLAYGEVLDIERAFDTKLAISAYLELAERKTGELFRLCCLLGAAEAGVPPETARVLGAFGSDLGVAFQILDDCLDLAAGGTGKPTGTDHLLGLFGAPTLFALTRDDTGELGRLLLSPGLSGTDMPAVCTLVTSRGGLTAAEQLARERRHRAVAALDGQPDRAACGRLMRVADLAWGERT